MPIGCSSMQAARRLAAGVVGGEPALLHRRRGERREADDVADRVDVLDLGAEVVVDLDPAAVVGGQPGVLRLSPSVVPCRPAEYMTGVGGDPLAALQAS